MCRLYGFRANELTKVECTLVYAQNALLRQSARDQRGLAHSDGWGISYYENGHPKVERRDAAAHEDQLFSVTAERMYSKTVLAHVRAATVGMHSLANTHPFVHDRWSFAHNGTVRGFESLRPRLERETRPGLLAHRRGDTDSETVFYWLLARMERAGLDLRAPCALARLVETLAEAISRLETLCASAKPEQPARLNFVLTNGVVMLASRWRNSLSWLTRDGVHDCEICGIPHIRHAPGKAYRAIVIASEPITHEQWSDVPDASIVAVDANLNGLVHRI